MILWILQYGPQASVGVLACGVVPLSLRLCGRRHAKPRVAPEPARRLSGWLMVTVVALLALALACAPGGIAAVLALPYVGLCFYDAAQAGIRVVTRAHTPLAEFMLDWSHMQLAGAAVWTWSICAGHALLGYPPVWVALTAAHFYAAGFVLPVLAGVLARRRHGRVHPGMLLAPLVGMPLTAVGIYCARSVEILAGFIMVVSTLWLAFEFWREARRTANGFLAFSAVCALVSMPLAGLHLLRRYDLLLFAGQLDPLSSMVLTHGLLNTLGFALVGVVGLSRARPAPLDAPPGRPHSRLAAGAVVGADYFARQGLQTAAPAHGLVDKLEHLHAGASALAPSIRSFYEHTDVHALRVRSRWQYSWAARIWRRLGQRMQQLQLPSDDHADETISSRIFTLNSERDGRSQVRAWVRQRANGAAMYVAAYSTHCLAAQPYMNIAFPLPGGNLTSILRLEILEPDGTAMALTTLAQQASCDAGVFWVLAKGALALRLPMNETIRVWDIAAPTLPDELRQWAGVDATAVARHEVWFFGLPWIRLDYAMWPQHGVTDGTV